MIKKECLIKVLSIVGGSHGYFKRSSIISYKRKHPNLPLPLIKALQFHYVKDTFFKYTFEIIGEHKIPIVLTNKKIVHLNPN